MRSPNPHSLDRGTVSTITTPATYNAIAAQGERNLTKATNGGGLKVVHTADYIYGRGDDGDDDDSADSVSGTEATDFGSLTSVE